VRIDSAGDVGIGTGDPTQKLEIRKDTTTAGSEGNILIQNYTSGTTPYYIGGIFGAAYRDVRFPAYCAGIDFYRTSSAGGLASSGEIRFYTDGNGGTQAELRTAEKMRLDANGNLLVGTTSQIGSGKVSIVANDAIAIKGVSGIGSGSIKFYRADNSAKSWSIETDGDTFYIADADFSRYAYAPQNFTAWSFGSDRRIKKDIVDLEYGLEAVLNMQPRRYTFIDNETSDIGFIAQELKECIPEAVQGSEIEFDDADTRQERVKKTMGVSKETLIPVLVKAIQEQQAMIDELKAKVAALEAA
jgi:hypothetical protein